jgi:hypothetical protein
LIPLVLIEVAVLFPYGIRKLEFRPGRLLQTAVVEQAPCLAAVAAFCEMARLLSPPAGWVSVGLIGGGAGLVLAAVHLLMTRIRREPVAGAAV